MAYHDFLFSFALLHVYISKQSAASGSGCLEGFPSEHLEDDQDHDLDVDTADKGGGGLKEIGAEAPQHHNDDLVHNPDSGDSSLEEGGNGVNISVLDMT